MLTTPIDTLFASPSPPSKTDCTYDVLLRSARPRTSKAEPVPCLRQHDIGGTLKPHHQHTPDTLDGIALGSTTAQDHKQEYSDNMCQRAPSDPSSTLAVHASHVHSTAKPDLIFPLMNDDPAHELEVPLDPHEPAHSLSLSCPIDPDRAINLEAVAVIQACVPELVPKPAGNYEPPPQGAVLSIKEQLKAACSKLYDQNAEKAFFVQKLTQNDDSVPYSIAKPVKCDTVITKGNHPSGAPPTFSSESKAVRVASVCATRTPLGLDSHPSETNSAHQALTGRPPQAFAYLKNEASATDAPLKAFAYLKNETSATDAPPKALAHLKNETSATDAPLKAFAHWHPAQGLHLPAPSPTGQKCETSATDAEPAAPSTVSLKDIESLDLQANTDQLTETYGFYGDPCDPPILMSAVETLYMPGKHTNNLHSLEGEDTPYPATTTPLLIYVDSSHLSATVNLQAIKRVQDTPSKDGNLELQRELQKMGGFLSGHYRVGSSEATAAAFTAEYLSNDILLCVEEAVETQSTLNATAQIGIMNVELLTLHRKLCNMVQNGAAPDDCEHLRVHISAVESANGELPEITQSLLYQANRADQHYANCCEVVNGLLLAYERFFTEQPSAAEEMMKECDGIPPPGARNPRTGSTILTGVYALVSNVQLYLKSVCSTLEAFQIWSRAYSILLTNGLAPVLDTKCLEHLLIHLPTYTKGQRSMAKEMLEEKPRAVTELAMDPAHVEPQGLELFLSNANKGVKKCMSANVNLPSDTPFPEVYEPPSEPLPVGDEAFISEIDDMKLSQDDLLDLLASLPYIEELEPSSPASETESPTDDEFDEAHLPFKKRMRPVNLTGPNTDLGSSRTLPPLSLDSIGRSTKPLGAATSTVTWKHPLTTTAPSQLEPDTCDRIQPRTLAHVAQHGEDLSGFSPLEDFKTSLSVIEAWAGEPTTPPQTPHTEIHAFVPINNAAEGGLPSGQPNGGAGNPRLRPTTPTPTREDSPSRYFDESAFDDPAEPTLITPTKTNNEGETEAKPDTPVDLEPLVTPDGPAEVSEPTAPRAPAASNREAPFESPARRRRLDLGHAPVNKDAAWGGEPICLSLSRRIENNDRICFDWTLGRECTPHCAHYGWRHACQSCGLDCSFGEGRYDCSGCTEPTVDAYHAEPDTGPCLNPPPSAPQRMHPEPESTEADHVIPGSRDPKGDWRDGLEWSTDHVGAAEQLRREIECEKGLTPQEPETSEAATTEQRTQLLHKSRPRTRNSLAATSAIDISRRVEEERAKVSPQRYIDLATNNLQALLADKNGARCYHCLGAPTIKPDTETCDRSTVLCPLCTIDSVVPASAMADEATIHAWRFLAFCDVSSLDELPNHIAERLSEEGGRAEWLRSGGPSDTESSSKTPNVDSSCIPCSEQEVRELPLDDSSKLNSILPTSTDPPRAMAPEEQAASELYSQASSQSNLPAAYIDTRPVTVAFKGDAAGATVIIVGGATAPIEQGGNGLQANQEITINASRCQVHPRALRDQAEHSQPESLSPYSRRSFAYEHLRRKGQSREGKTLRAPPQWRKPVQNSAADRPRPAKPIRSSKSQTTTTPTEWRSCGIEHVYASVKRPGQNEATYVPSWQAQLWDKEKGDRVRGPRRYNFLEAARDVAELSRRGQATQPENHKEALASPARPSCHYDPAINMWYTGRATLLDDRVGVINETAHMNGQQYSFEYNYTHGFPLQRPAAGQPPTQPVGYWVAFRKDPKVHPGQALSVVRLLIPDGPMSKTAPAHRPPLSEGRYSLPLVSIVDSLPTVEELYARFYENSVTYRPYCPHMPSNVAKEPNGLPTPGGFGQDNAQMARGNDLTLQYTKFPERFGFAAELPILRHYARVYKSGLTFPYGGKEPDLSAAGDPFKHKYCVLLNYMLSHAPKELFCQIRMKGIYFVKDLTYGGNPTKTLVVPSAGVILVNVTELTQALSAATEPGLLKTLTHKVSRVLHEISHLCDYKADPEGWQMPDSMLEYMLPGYKFPSAGTCSAPNISCATRSQLPNHMLYAATAPEEFRAESLADIWMSEGPARDQQKKAQAYWEARSRTPVPALFSMLRRGFQTLGNLPDWGRDALFLYRIGDHREVTPIAIGLRELAHCRSTHRVRQQGWGPSAYAGGPEASAELVEGTVGPPLWQVRMREKLADVQDEGGSPTPQDETPSDSPMPDCAFSKAAQDVEEARYEDARQEQPLGLHMTGATNRITRRELSHPKSNEWGEHETVVTPYKQNWNRCPEWRGEKRVFVAAAAPRHPGTVLPLTKHQHAGSHAIRKALPARSLGREDAFLNEGSVRRGARRQGGALGKSRYSPPESEDNRTSFVFTRGDANQQVQRSSQIERNQGHRSATDSFLAEICPLYFLDNMESRYARALSRPPLDQKSAEIEVRFDIKGKHCGQHHRVRLDLNESAALLLYQIVLQVIGHVSRNMLSWRLLGGPCRISFDVERSGQEAGLRDGSCYTLVGRMRGGGDEPPPSEGSDFPLESPTEGDHLDQLSLGLLEALPATPAQAAPAGGERSSQPEPTPQLQDPLQFSPPYRPMGGETVEGSAEVRADGTTPQGQALPLPIQRQKGENPGVTRLQSTVHHDATPNIPPATPLEADRISHSEGLTPAEADTNHTEHPHDADEYIEAEVQRRVNQKVEARIEAEIQARIEAETQARLALAANSTLEGIEEVEFRPTQGGLGAGNSYANAEPSRAARSVNFGSAPSPHPANRTVEEPASLPHRPRSERAPGTETRWQHFHSSGPEHGWDDDPMLPSHQSSARNESPPSPPYRSHGPGNTPTAATSARAARRGASGSTYSMPNDTDVDTQEDTLSYWEKEESTTFTDAPSESTMRRYFERHQVDPAVVELVERVRCQPWQANTASPHTNCFNPNLERPPLRQKQYSTKKLSETRTSQKDFKFFNDPKLTAPTEHDQVNAWIKVRAEICITLRTCVDTRCAGPEFLPAIRDELNRLLGHTQALPQLAALIVQGLQTFVTLASNCLLLACDNHFCPEYSPLTALQTVQRKSGQALVDLFANIELLMLQSKNQEQEGRDFLYVTLRHSDRQVIPDLHRYAVQAIESGDQPWAAEVALAFDRACTNARAYARTVSERDRPAVLQLQAIAFTAGIIGLDQNLSLGYRNGGQLAYGSYDREDPSHLTRQPRARNARTRNPVAPVTTRSAGPPPRMQQQPSLTTTSFRGPSPAMPPQQPPPPPPAPPQQLQHLRPMEHPGRPMERPTNYQSAEPRRTGAPTPGKQEVTTTNLWIDMAEIRRAAEESDQTRKRLATMIWPTDDCTRFAADIECKATPVFETDGKPAYFNDGRPMVTFNNKKACRFCSVWAAQPGNIEDWKAWPQEVQDGQHNPKVCPRSIAALLKTGNVGASFLKERWGKKPTRPEGGQRRAGQ